MIPQTMPPVPRRRHRGLLVGVLVHVVVGGAAAYIGLLHDWHPQRHGAVVVFHISPPQPILLRVRPEPEDYEAFRQSQAALIKTRRVLNAALNDPHVHHLASTATRPDPLAWLEENLHVTLDSEYMRVVLTGEPGDEMVAMLDAVAKAYLASTAERTHGAQVERRSQLLNVHASLEQELRLYHRKMEEIANVLGANDEKILALRQEMLLHDFQTCHETIQRLRHDAALFKGGVGNELDPHREGALVAAGGGRLRPVAPLGRLVYRLEDSPAGRRIATELTLWEERLRAVNESLSQFNKYRFEMDSLRKDMHAKETLAGQIYVEAERLRIELNAPARVALVDEAAPLRAP
jgi:hypothetical protein